MYQGRAEHLATSNKQHHDSTGECSTVSWSKQATIVATNMFRLLSRQAFKAVPRPRPRPGLCLSNGTTSRYVHSMQAPYDGLPSYDTIARRFSSSQVDPQVFFTRKRQQEAQERGEFIDIHDIGIDPNDYDVLITDVKHETLETTVAEELGIPYLSKATEADAKEVVQVGNGYIYGRKFSAIIPFVVSHGDESRWVFFIMDSGAPLTYLSAEASKILGVVEDRATPVTIGGHPKEVYMSPRNSHFTDINLLGTDFCSAHNTNLWFDFQRRRMKMYFGKKWKVVEESKL
ncbi:uncharacterized protein H6S33_012956 [Morchella sextelata]|uniref:uncharacterized protein n=1 Tax=Morchella sextelata TaxID=1174677 RepID=UPI001D056B5E|nr:uncharacterized protein H6S33_012956 [Morchella sextelata]KAH0609470.1 hypothetical protein H6S33_012956 [Morchella sextelata]